MILDNGYKNGLRRFEAWLEEAGRYDLSVSFEGLGTLFSHQPNSAIGKISTSLAQAYGAAHVALSTGGTTALNKTAIAACARSGDTILIDRSCHVSVYAGVMALQAHPTYLYPEERRYGGLACITPTQLEAALREQAASLVVLTNPRYSGAHTELEPLVRIAHDQGARIMIDAAHGAYYGHHPRVPGFPGAGFRDPPDIVTTSVHKTTRALGQASSAIIYNADLVDDWYEAVNSFANESTSFSTLIAASLELALSELRLKGHDLLERALEASDWFRERAARLPMLRPLTEADMHPDGLDMLRVTIDVRDTGMTGFEVAAALHELGVVVEMASFQDVLFLLTPHDNRSSVAIALDALEKVTTLASFKRPSRFAQLPPLPMVQPERALEPFEVFPKRAQTTMVPWRKAVGRIAANTCGAYPPGYPLIVAGERWPVETLEYLRGVVREGGQLKGNFADPELESIRVVVES